MSLPDADDSKYDVSASDDQGVDLSQTCEVSQASEISSVTRLATAADQRIAAAADDTDDDEDSEIFETEKPHAASSAMTSSITADNEYTSMDVGTDVAVEGGLSTSSSNEALSLAAVSHISESEQAYQMNCDGDDIYKQSSADPPDAVPPPDAGSVVVQPRSGDIGELTDANEVPAVYLVRLLCSEFLLTGYQCVLMPDQCVRVSVKALALMCVACLVDLCPRTFIVKLHKTSNEPGNCIS
jgi:huntingtin